MTYLRTILIVLCALAQTGCVPLVAGAAVAGGYYVGQDERTAGQISDDLAITTKVKALLIKEQAIRALDINVDTRLRVVTLSGKVASTTERDLAVTIANGVKGVASVASELRVRPVTVQEKSI